MPCQAVFASCRALTCLLQYLTAFSKYPVTNYPGGSGGIVGGFVIFPSFYDGQYGIRKLPSVLGGSFLARFLMRKIWNFCGVQ
jgi:hypothetical protein